MKTPRQGPRPSRSLAVAGVGAVLALSLSASTILAAPARPALPANLAAPTVLGLPAWTGGMDLYRSGVFATQQTWWWCQATSAQIMRNIVSKLQDHTAATQRTIFNYMRAHQRYSFPYGYGTDPQGWAAGVAQYVDASYRLYTYSSYDTALKEAVTRMRLTQLPISVLVMNGYHTWVLHGFTATADPAITRNFTVTSVRVSGPLYGKAGNHYDLPPDSQLSTSAFKAYFKPFDFAPVRMVWQGQYMTVQPIPRSGPFESL
jgi:hypothetical protein